MTLFQTGALSDWVGVFPVGERRPTAVPTATLVSALLNTELLASLARRLELQVRWLTWLGEPDTAARLAAHVPTSPQREPGFQRFAAMWGQLFIEGRPGPRE